jgi:predicted nucleic acid-binding protein
VLPVDSDAASVAARIWASLGRAQQQGVGDIMIAGVAVTRQLPVVTRNRVDFERIARSGGVELKLLDWAS